MAGKSEQGTRNGGPDEKVGARARKGLCLGRQGKEFAFHP